MLLAFLSLVMAGPIASDGAEIDAFKRTKFLQFNRSANEGVTC